MGINDRDTVVWLDAQQADIVRRVSDAVGLRIVGIGSPQPGEAGYLAERVRPGPDRPKTFDDLRSLLASARAELIWLAAPFDDPHDHDTVSPATLAGCRDRDTRLITFEPVPSSVMHLTGWTEDARRTRSGHELIRFCPLTRLMPEMRELTDVLETFGTVRSMWIEAAAAPGQGSVGARLFDAIDLLIAVMGEPDRVFATYAPDLAGHVLHRVPTDSLCGFHGEISFSAHFADGRIGTVNVSDRAGRHIRRCHLIGDAGGITIDETTTIWHRADGEELERTARTDSNFESAVIEQLNRFLDPTTQPPPPVDSRRVLAVAGAGLLSARTGEPLAPSMILGMVEGAKL